MHRAPRIFEGLDVDFAAHPKPQDSKRKWHVCILYFTPAAKWFVQGWIDHLKDWSDELAFQQFWETGPQISHIELPDEYFYIPSPRELVPRNIVYSIGISSSEQKEAFKAAQKHAV